MGTHHQTGSRRARGRRAPKRFARLRRMAKAARSGLKRYPRALLESVREARRPRERVRGESLPDLEHHDLAAVWLGHSSVLVRVGGMNILADPVFAHRIGVSMGGLTLGLPRHAPAPVREEHLPPIDLILISHAHFDHLDKPTLKRLASRRTRVITARNTARLIPRGFGEVVELDWGGSVRINDLDLSALRPAHYGARTALDRRRGYNSYILRTGSRPRSGGVLLAGDTAKTDAFNHLPNLALAVFGIGSYENWEHAHATPEEAWSMFRASGAARLLPVHHSTFPMGDEHVDEPMERLLAAAGKEAERVIRAEPGAVWTA